MPRVSWVKASVDDLAKYQSVLSYKLHHVHLPSTVILCTNRDHIDAISAYADAISDACLSVADCCIPRTCHQHSKVVYLDGVNGWTHFVRSLYSGIKYGSNVDVPGQVLSLIV